VSDSFQRIDTIEAQLKKLYQDTISLDSFPADAILDMGDLATIRKTSRNITPEVIHMDTVFGPYISFTGDLVG
jgi:hypothetical protein